MCACVSAATRSKARTANFGLRGVFEREFWTNSAPHGARAVCTSAIPALTAAFVCVLAIAAPGELALVWDHKGEL